MIIVSTFICLLNSKCWKKRWTHVSFCCYCCAICCPHLLLIPVCLLLFCSLSILLVSLSVVCVSTVNFSLTSCFIWCNSLSLATFSLPSSVLFHSECLIYFSSLPEPFPPCVYSVCVYALSCCLLLCFLFDFMRPSLCSFLLFLFEIVTGDC